MEWLKKLSDAVTYIERNLDNEISLDEAARIACCSPFYSRECFLMWLESPYRNISAAAG